jgi:hypothetical protein
LTAIRVAKAQLAVPSGEAPLTNIPRITHSFRRGTFSFTSANNAITIQGFGDTHLLVPTGPGISYL